MTTLKKLIATGSMFPLMAFGLAATPAHADIEGDDSIVNDNSAEITNVVSAESNTGGNSAGGSFGGDAGDGGDISTTGDGDVEDSATGAGGAGGDGSPGGLITTGAATAEAGVLNVVNTNRTRVNRGTTDDDEGNTSVSNTNWLGVENTVAADASTGDNEAEGSEGGNGGEGGSITSGDEEVDDSTTGAGGEGGLGSTGGDVLTGDSTSRAGVINIVNRNVTRIRR